MQPLQELALIDDINAHIAQIRSPILQRYNAKMDQYNTAMGTSSLQDLALIDDINAHIAQIRSPILQRYNAKMDQYNQAMGTSSLMNLENIIEKGVNHWIFTHLH